MIHRCSLRRIVSLRGVLDYEEEYIHVYIVAACFYRVLRLHLDQLIPT